MNIIYTSSFIGRKYGLLTITDIITIDGRKKFKCKCDCGNLKNICPTDLVKGKTQSCGCYNKLQSTINNTNHGLSKDRFYKIFYGILARCNNPNRKSYKYYGERGIKCEWKSFEEYYNDMYESYLEHLEINGEYETTIDRLDNNGNYCKENCKWSTKKEQSHNKRKKIYYNGKRIIDYVSEGQIYSTIYSRMVREHNL